ncbi:uncharacterized protein PG986_000472 [Apiospora aurea]|uniref:Uncharacterized protein n=1 Tax=Apiospora aurea TaxID=335848 RepID=A0ABR1QVT4_9PEZI
MLEDRESWMRREASNLGQAGVLAEGGSLLALAFEEVGDTAADDSCFVDVELGAAVEEAEPVLGEGAAEQAGDDVSHQDPPWSLKRTTCLGRRPKPETVGMEVVEVITEKRPGQLFPQWLHLHHSRTPAAVSTKTSKTHGLRAWLAGAGMDDQSHQIAFYSAGAIPPPRVSRAELAVWRRVPGASSPGPSLLSAANTSKRGDSVGQLGGCLLRSSRCTGATDLLNHIPALGLVIGAVGQTASQPVCQTNPGKNRELPFTSLNVLDCFRLGACTKAPFTSNKRMALIKEYAADQHAWFISRGSRRKERRLGPRN